MLKNNAKLPGLAFLQIQGAVFVKLSVLLNNCIVFFLT